MKTKRTRYVLRLAGLALLGCLAGCGGGSSVRGDGGSTGGSGGGTSPPPSNLTITTPQILPGALIGQAYITTLTATGGTGVLTWTIAPIPTTLYATGLTINANTGVVSGTANFQGTGGFTAQVTDAASHTASQGFAITASPPLTSTSPQTFAIQQYFDAQAPLMTNTVVTGGVAPLSFLLTSQCLPAGLRMDNASGLVYGSPIAIGVFPCGVTVQDSFSPPELVSGQFTIAVNPPPLSVVDNSLPQAILLNRPFNGRAVAKGGIPPYHFSIGPGSLPPGLNSIDPSGGQVNGTPITLGSYNVSVDVQDFSSPAQTATANFWVTVKSPIGRNDTPATATPADNGSIGASISPYIDPPDGAPLPSDSDYYKLVSLGGSTVHVLMESRTPTMEPALAIVDVSDSPYNSCRQAGDTSTNFSSICVNDTLTEATSGIDATLDFQVPGAANAATTFYVHALDWKGIARPDNAYALSISGVVDPLAIQTTQLPAAARSFSYSQALIADNGTGNIVWSVSGGSLPPGLSITGGNISGTPTTDGTFPFTLQAADSATPPQTATAKESILVGEPVRITSSPNLPDGCVNQPYSFTFQSSGGIPPLRWSLAGYVIGINLDPSTINSANASFTGVPLQTGTFTDSLALDDASVHGEFQTITYTINQCP